MITTIKTIKSSSKKKISHGSCNYDALKELEENAIVSFFITSSRIKIRDRNIIKIKNVIFICWSEASFVLCIFKCCFT